MALKKVKGNIERMFDKNLTDLVRGIRNNKENEVRLLWILPIVIPFFLIHLFFQAKYISQCMEDIKLELRQDNLSVKSNAIAKLTYVSLFSTKTWSSCFRSFPNCNWKERLIYHCDTFQLQMLGYDISWAGFNVIEVMSSSKFTLKRIGYLAASQSFHCDSEVIEINY